MTYAERLSTFEVFWDGYETAARQLAAIGHVSDRPPLEALEAGSRCISCGAFVKKDLSIRALGDISTGASYDENFENFNFHHPNCIRLQVRIPLEPQALLPGLYGHRFANVQNMWERRIKRQNQSAPSEKASQSSSLFSLPTEVRLEIYAMILPSLDPLTEIVTMNSESPRVITKQGSEKTGPLDLTKPNILRTCRTVNEEAMDIIYAHTTFRFASTKVMYLFLRAIGKNGRSMVTGVDVDCGQRDDAIAFALLASCEKLRRITIRLGRRVLFLPGSPLWLIEGVSCLLSLSGLKEVSFVPSKFPIWMSDENEDAEVIRKALTRPRGTAGDDTIMKNHLEP